MRCKVYTSIRIEDQNGSAVGERIDKSTGFVTSLPERDVVKSVYRSYKDFEDALLERACDES